MKRGGQTDSKWPTSCAISSRTSTHIEGHSEVIDQGKTAGVLHWQQEKSGQHWENCTAVN